MSGEDMNSRIEEVLNDFYSKEMENTELSYIFHKHHVIDFNHVIHDQVLLDRGEIPPFLEYGKALIERPISMFDSIVCDPLNDKELRSWVMETVDKFKPKLEEVFSQMEAKNRVVSEVREVLKNISTDVGEFFGGFPITKEIKTNMDTAAKKVKKKNGSNIVRLSDLRGNGTSELRSLLFKVLMDNFRIPCRLERGDYDEDRKKKGDEEEENGESDDEEEEMDTQCTYCKILVFDKLFLVDLTRKPDLQSKMDDLKCYIPKCTKKELSLDLFRFQNNEKWDVEFDKTIAQGSFSNLKLGTPSSKKIKKLLRSSSSNPAITKIHKRVCCREINFKRRMFGKIKLRHLFKKHVTLVQILRHENIVEYLGSYREKDTGSLYARYYENSLDGKKFLETLADEETEEVYGKEKVKKQFVEVLIFLLKICRGMRYVHQCGFIFFALPLSKVLVEWDDENKKIVEARLRVNNLSLLRKKEDDMLRNFNRKYCAPEVLEGMKGLPSSQDPYTWKVPFLERMDVYSVGKMMEDCCKKFEVMRGYGRFVKIMNKCLSDIPSYRPTIQHVMFELVNMLRYLKNPVE